MVCISSPDEFHEKMKSCKVKNILIGNGFCLSHPQLRECFEWNMHQALCRDSESLIPGKSRGCPEKDLNDIRINATKRILYYYVNNMKKELLPNSENLSELFQAYNNNIQWTCSNFLKAEALKGGNILTLNYDPLLYFEILKLLENEKIHFDGFIVSNDSGKDRCINQHPNPISRKPFLKQKYIKCKLEKETRGKIKVLYLHGSWFILANEHDELKKVSFSSDSKSITVDSLFENERRPFLILEDRWRNKMAILKADPYLKYCYGCLKKIENNLLVFGCSFNNDQHIVKAIKNNKALEKIFVAYRTDQDKGKLERCFNDSKPSIEFWNIGDNVIWEKIS